MVEPNSLEQEVKIGESPKTLTSGCGKVIAGLVIPGYSFVLCNEASKKAGRNLFYEMGLDLVQMEMFKTIGYAIVGSGLYNILTQG